MQEVKKDKSRKVYSTRSIKALLFNRRGQSSIEFVLLLPLLTIIILVVSQLGYLVYLQNTLEQAAREGTRIISTTNSNSLAHSQVLKVCQSLDLDRISIGITPSAAGERRVGETVRVTISYQYGGLANFLNVITGKEFLVRSSSIMRMESE